MYRLFALLAIIFASTDSFEFGHKGGYFHGICSGSEYSTMHSYFCEPFFEYFKKVLKPFPTANECETCENVVKELRKEGDVNRVVENFIGTISERFCESLDVTVRDQCKLWTKTYSGNIKDFAKELIEKETLCHVMLDCKKNEIFHENVFSFEIKKTKNDYPICQNCIDGVKFIEEKLLKGVTVDTISNLIDNMICLNVPMKLYPNCHDYARTFAAKVIKLTTHFKDAARLCDEMNLCKETPENYFFYHFFNHFAHKEVTPITICQACNNVTKDQFRNMANIISVEQWKLYAYGFFCHDLTQETPCSEFIDMAIVPLVNKIRHFISGENICGNILHCPKESYFYTFYEQFHRFYSVMDKNSDNECVLCKVLSAIFIKTLSEPSAVEIAEFVYRVAICNDPKNNNEKCLEDSKTEIPKLFKTMIDQLKKGKLCTQTCKVEQDTEFPSFWLKNEKKCVFCEKVIHKLKESIGFENKNKMWIELKMDAACSKMPLNEKAQCRELMTKNKKDIKRMLMKHESTHMLCLKIKQCSKNIEFYSNYFEGHEYPVSWSHYPHEFFNNDTSLYDFFFSKQGYYPFSYYFYNDSSFFHDLFNKYSQYYHHFYNGSTTEIHYPFHHYFDKDTSFPHHMFQEFLTNYHRYFDYHNHENPMTPIHEDAYQKYFSYFYYAFFPYDFQRHHSAFDSSFEHAYPFSSFSKSYDYKTMDFGKEKYHPYRFLERYFQFPNYYFEYHVKPSTESCNVCKHYIVELKKLQEAFVAHPIYWRVLVDDMCLTSGLEINGCRTELDAYFESMFRAFRSGKSLESICEHSCQTFEHPMFMCFFEPKKYCMPDQVKHCGIHGEKFCKIYMH